MTCQAYHSFTDGPVASFVTQRPSLLFRGFFSRPRGGVESPEVTVGTIRHGGRSRRGEARRSSKIGPLGLAEKMCYNRPGGKIHRDHEIGELITIFIWEKKLMQMLLVNAGI